MIAVGLLVITPILLIRYHDRSVAPGHIRTHGDLYSAPTHDGRHLEAHSTVLSVREDSMASERTELNGFSDLKSGSPFNPFRKTTSTIMKNVNIPMLLPRITSHNYKLAPIFKEIDSILEQIYSQTNTRLVIPLLITESYVNVTLKWLCSVRLNAAHLMRHVMVLVLDNQAATSMFARNGLHVANVIQKYGLCMSNIPFSYMLYAYSVKEPIGELNLKRA